jgi:DnaJ-class molecular chaperone
MDFYCQEVGTPKNCPDCGGKGRLPYPYCFYPCSRCEGKGRIIKVMLTYPESYDAGFHPAGSMMFAGYIERPYPVPKEVLY